ncbi:MAG: NAD(P)-dependent glycerol-3-phosphate dehydrogenase [Chthoniobacterales bacterium]|nr:NAD(P)-dependent glycerol-3-phosphate dehydrogenase [Chthoniobacterales bacterium]
MPLPKCPRKLGIVGAGGWGTALAVRAASAGFDVLLWCYEADVANEIAHNRTNSRYLPDVTIPSSVRPITDFKPLEECAYILLVVPSKAVRHVALKLCSDFDTTNVHFISCTKGIDFESGKVMSEVWREILKTPNVSVLSGPNIAPEVARGAPAAAVLGFEDENLLQKIQAELHLPAFRIYTSSDVKGIQLGGALKNIYAIAAGCVDGFKLGDNAKAALITRSLAEMMRLGTALGGRRETFHGLSGIGDLIVTCFSSFSRNRTFGERLGKGETPHQILASMHNIAEGVPTTKAAFQLARKFGIETPVLDGIHSVLYSGKSPKEIMQALLERTPKPENL